MPSVRDSGVVPASRRATSIALGSVALAVAAVAVLVLLGVSAGRGGDRPCSSYPAPGMIAPAGTKVPAGLVARYSLFSDSQRAVDKLAPAQIASLHASGLIMSGTRFVGDAAFGGRIYLVPAEHLLASSLAPPRCLSAVQRLIQQAIPPVAARRVQTKRAVHRRALRQDPHPGLHSRERHSYALMSEIGTPGFGLVPDGVSAVTVTYQIATPRTVVVRRNFFVVPTASRTAPPCGVQWLDPTGSVSKIPVGCSYLALERPALTEYRSFVLGKLSTLRTQVRALAAAIDAGNVANARSTWVTAHLTWLEIGQDDGAYGSFGALGGEIDGLAAGHPLGTADPEFTGFHRIEFDLWSKHDLPAAGADTMTLQHLLARLAKVPLSTYLPATPAGIGSWLLRPHEVLEDALRDSLTADDEYGSGTDLASIAADVAAVRKLLSELEPVLHPIAPDLVSQARAELDALIDAVDATRANGAWVPIKNVPIRQRQQVDADVGAALETLAPIPDLVTSTGSNSPVT